jgi:hypothetical protein
MSGEKDLSCGETTPGSSIMTDHDNAPARASRDFLANTNTNVSIATLLA